MAKIKFITVRGKGILAHDPYYVGIPQHERTLTAREAYELVAEHTGYKPTAVRAVFKALADFVRDNQALGNITYIDGVASIRNYVRGAFESLSGPWNKGVNLLVVNAVEMDPFKSLLAGIVPVNNTEGAKPVINTVLDEVTFEYDVIAGTNPFSIAGADLAPDAEKPDEYVALMAKDGTETRAAIEFSDLQNVRARLAAALPAGEYTLKVCTRSGLGEEYGVHVATRKVAVA